MDKPPSGTMVQLGRKMTDYIDKAVTERVNEELDVIRKQIDQTLGQIQNTSSSAISNRATIVAFSGDMDKLMAAFIIATGAATMGMEVSVYCTFWALAALKKKTRLKGKPISEKLIAIMLPSGPAHLGTSEMNMMGIGPAFFGYVMKKKNIQSLPDLIGLARETGVRIIACQMAMDVMGILKEELIDDLDYGGVTTYMADACDSKVTLFI